MSAALDLAFADQGKPALNEVDPRSRSRREVHVKARMARKPSLDRGRLVRAVVVQDQVHLELGRDIGLDGAQERQELFGAVTPMQFTDDMARGKVQRRKQGR